MEFAPPPGPPPPKVPEGWKAVWNDQYKEWFYVNIYTKKSQWEKPTEPVYPPGESETAPPPGPPPSYDHTESKSVSDQKAGLSSNNPYASSSHGASSSHDISEDERLARQLQAEEEARAHANATPSSRGAADSYYNQPAISQAGQYPPQQELPPRTEERSGKSKGLLGKLLGKSSSSSHQQQPQYAYQQQQYYGAPAPGAYGYQQSYYPQQGYPQQAYAGRKSGGLGTGGAAALGVGGGLLGGMLLADALDDHDYQEGYQEGYDDGADGGGDDFGGDF